MFARWCETACEISNTTVAFQSKGKGKGSSLPCTIMYACIAYHRLCTWHVA